MIVICFCGYKFLFNKQPESVANDFEKELAECDKAIKQNPNDAYIGYGFRLRILGLRFPEKYELALEVYNKAIALNPNHFQAYLNKGAVLIQLGKYDLALEAYNKAIEVDPSHPYAYNNKAEILRKLEKYDLYLESYNKALELEPNDFETQAQIQTLDMQKAK